MEKFIKACKIAKRSKCIMEIEDYRNSVRVVIDMIDDTMSVKLK